MTRPAIDRALSFLALALALWAQAAPATTIVIVNNDGPGEGLNDPTPVAAVPGNPGTTRGQQRLNVLNAAASAWSQTLGGAGTVRVGAQMDPLDCTPTSALLGSAGPDSVFRDFPGAERTGTWYAVALANHLRGSDLDPGSDDIGAQFNSRLDSEPACLGPATWFYGIGTATPANAISFLETVLHELAHGLGFATFVDIATGAKLQGFDDAFMVHLEDHSRGQTWNALNNTQRAASARDDGDLHWVGSSAVADGSFLGAGRHPSGHLQMFAPVSLAPGSSVSHWDTDLFPDELMEPFATATSNDILTTALLADLGWTLQGGGGGGPCVPSDTVLCVDNLPGDRRFRVTVDVDTNVGAGLDGPGHAIALTSLGVARGGLFWFFNPANPEMLIKVLNGCPINGNFWVFWSAGTNVGMTIRAVDTVTGENAIYVNPDSNPALPVQDVVALPCS